MRLSRAACLLGLPRVSYQLDMGLKWCQARQHGLLELSARPSLLAAAAAGGKAVAPRVSCDALEAGQLVAGCGL